MDEKLITDVKNLVVLFDCFQTGMEHFVELLEETTLEPFPVSFPKEPWYLGSYLEEIDRLAQRGIRPLAVVVDIWLAEPVRDGIKLVQGLCQEYPGIPVLIWTQQETPENRKKLLQLSNVDSIYDKYWEDEELKDRLEELYATRSVREDEGPAVPNPDCCSVDLWEDDGILGWWRRFKKWIFGTGYPNGELE